MSYNGSGTFNINTAGQPVVTGTVISSTAFNALTADLATGLSTAITKDGQTAATARIPFAQGISSTLVTDSSSTTTGSIITAGGAGVAKALFVGTTANVAGAVTLQSTLAVGGVATYSAQPIFSSLTASSAVATDASKGLVSVTNTGTGNNVLSTSPTLVTPVLGAAAATSVTVAAGAVGTPSITTTGNTNTGIFFPAADTIAFAEGGAEAMRITSTGDVGIGTSSPAGKLHVNGGTFDSLTVSGNSTNSVGMRLQNSAASARNWNIGSSGGGVSPAGSFFIYDDTASATRMVIDSSGNVGIGTTSPTAFASRTVLDIVGPAAGNGGLIRLADASATSVLQIFASTGSPASSTIRTATATALNFGTDTTERMRIDSSGNLLVGATSQISGERFSVTAGATNGVYFKNTAQASFTQLVWNSATSGDNSFIAFGTEGTYTGRGSITYNRAGGLVAYNVTSDYRAKDIYGPVTGSGALIDSVPVYMGKMKGATQERPMFIAHEVPAYAHTGVKDAVDADGKPVYQQMDASALIPVMWAEIQSLRKRLAAAGI